MTAPRLLVRVLGVRDVPVTPCEVAAMVAAGRARRASSFTQVSVG